MELNVGAIKDRIAYLEQEDSRYRNGIDHTERAELGTLKALLLAFHRPTVQGSPTKGNPAPVTVWGTISSIMEPKRDFGTFQYLAAPKPFPER